MRINLLGLLAVVGALATVMAAMAMWLVLQEPLAVADAAATGSYQPLLASLAREFDTWLRALARLL
jgi:hypothetical protein